MANVWAGEVEVTVGDQCAVLKAGDSIRRYEMAVVVNRLMSYRAA